MQFQGFPPIPYATADDSRQVTVCPIGADILEFPEMPFDKEETTADFNTSATDVFPLYQRCQRWQQLTLTHT
jgi:hypothetical protein